ncbi:M16 family metallopeptidase [Aciditerrimonas ferrireducens]|uniref:M16 family metallopeptidase n=1 Tax=Aciditerrimonas ferrireducens TaxID=667306 RepID=UPI002005BA98|nr:pitrilysin family protein [Aciditerrimonas ferrireducens]MCK4177725.1 insulinase family protein [Aciditerrimonas ferrireducens]
MRGQTAPVLTDRLPCGVQLVVEPMDHVASVTLGVWVGTGSRDEEPTEAGSSHFLEHLLFKGSARWPATRLAEAVDEVGGDMNAYTTKEHTTFYVRLLAEHLDLGLDVLGSILTEPTLHEADVRAERSVVLDELRMHADEPADVAAEQLAAALFPRHPLGRDVLGSEASVLGLDAHGLRRFFERHYRNDNLVVAAAGALDPEGLAVAVDQVFRDRQGGARPARIPPGPPTPRTVVSTRPTEQVQLALGVRGPGRNAEQRHALAVLAHVLGGGLSSRLFQEIRERRGLAYSVWAERVLFEETGYLALGAGTGPDDARQVLALLQAQLEDLAARGPTPRELAVAKAFLRADTLLGLEDSGARMHRIGAAQLLHGQVPPLEQLLARLEAVEAEEVAALAAELASGPRVVSAVGPLRPDQLP